MPFFKNKDGLNIYYEDINPNPKNFPIIFLHGQASAVSFFKHQINFLKEKYRCIPIDPIGLGRSVKPIRVNINDHLRDTYLRDIEDLIQKLNVSEGFGILSHSLLGGMIAQLLSQKYALKTKFLILLNSGCLMLDNDIRNSFWNILPYHIRMNFLEIVENSIDDVMDRTIPFIKLALKEASENQEYSDEELDQIIEKEIFDMVSESKEFDPSDIICPTLIIGGSLDNFAPANLSENLSEKIHNSQLILIEFAGHLAPSQIYKEINKYIGDFLKEIDLK